jgi:RNA:NAD 2'-phosphotransferase (TPT1/KptA family)
LADNGVWLTDQVPPEFLSRVAEDQPSNSMRSSMARRSQ